MSVCSPSPDQSALPAPQLPKKEKVLVPTPVTQTLDEPPSPSKRLRHKKINFKELLRGEDTSPSSSHTETICVDDSADTNTKLGKSRKLSSKEPLDVPAKRRRKESRKSNEETVTIPDPVDSEVEISVDEVSPDPVKTQPSKNKKRSHGSHALSSLGLNGRTNKSKFGPIKVNVRSLVHGGPSRFKKKKLISKNKKENVVTSSNPPKRILSVTHQDTSSTLTICESQNILMPPTADVYVDLFEKASALCVMCRVCQAKLSISGFLKHQHTTNDLSLVHVPQPRKLLLIDDGNVTLEDRKLWAEFVQRCALFETSAKSANKKLKSQVPETQKASVDRSEATKKTNVPKVKQESVNEKPKEEPLPSCDSPPTLIVRQKSKPILPVVETPPEKDTDSPTFPESDDTESNIVVSTNQESDKLSNIILPPSPAFTPPSAHSEQTKTVLEPSGDKYPSSVVTQQRSRKRSQSPTNVRHSSRKRKSKRLFGCENYEFASKRNSSLTDEDSQDGDIDILEQDMNHTTEYHQSNQPVLLETH